MRSRNRKTAQTIAVALLVTGANLLARRVALSQLSAADPKLSLRDRVRER